MKKFLLMFAAVAAIAFVGCKTETQPAEGEAQTDSIEAAAPEYTVESVTTQLMDIVNTGDEAQTLGFLDGIKAKAEELLNGGDQAGYFNIINILKSVWEANKDAIMAKIPTLAEKMTNYITVPDNLKPAFDKFVADAAQNVVDKAGDALNEAGEKVADVAEKAADKAGEVANDAKQQAGDALQKAGEELKK